MFMKSVTTIADAFEMPLVWFGKQNKILFFIFEYNVINLGFNMVSHTSNSTLTMVTIKPQVQFHLYYYDQTANVWCACFYSFHLIIFDSSKKN